MQVSELRRELADLADEIEPFGADLLSVHRRVRRRRGVVIVVTVAAVILAVVGVLALVPDRAPKVEVQSPRRLVQPQEMRGVDLIVTPADASVQQTLEHTDGVVRYTTLAQRSMSTDQSLVAPPNVHAAACAVLRAPAYAVETENPAAAAHVRAALDGAHAYDVTSPDDERVEVFMKPDAPQGQIDAVRAAIAQAPIKGFRFISHEDAYEEFKRLFAGQQALIDQTDPSALPVSFRIFGDRSESTRAIAAKVNARIKNLSGVDIVQPRDGTQWLVPMPAQSANPKSC